MNLRRGLVVGYLRHYRRWDGTPGFTLCQQRAWVREIARERGYASHSGRLYLAEQADGEARGWPTLQRVIQIAEDNADREILAVIPTLDGVQFNLSFLSRLVAGNQPVYVRSGWRRPKIIARNTAYAYRSKARGWLLSLAEEADDFAEIVARVRERNLALPAAIRAGLPDAVARGVPLGSRQRGTHRLTKADRIKGGQATGIKRRLAANQPYRKWVSHICQWRQKGDSIGQIVQKLADKGALTPGGRNIGRMLLWRILKREWWQEQAEGAS
jgi:hypothetical protein